MIAFKPVKDIKDILPLILLINTNTPEDLLLERLQEMHTQNYECIGGYINNQLIACMGLWFQTRHYSGRSVEPDHVVVDPNFRNQGVGEAMLTFCLRYAKSKGFEVSELNCYLHNTKGQEFWEKTGYKKLGYHYLKKLDLHQ